MRSLLLMFIQNTLQKYYTAPTMKCNGSPPEGFIVKANNVIHYIIVDVEYW